MANEELDKLLQQGIQAAKAGNRKEARRFLEQVLEQDDGNEQAWLVLASVVETPRERRICLENVLGINPNNERARQALERLRPSPPSGQVGTEATAGTPKPSATAAPATSTIRRPASQQPPPAIANRPGITTEGTKAAWRSQRNQGGINPQVAFFVLLGVTIIGVGLLLVSGNGGVEGPTAVPPTATRRVVQNLTPTPLGTIVEAVPNPLGIPPSWTPSPTPTPRPTETPAPTIPPLAGYRLIFVTDEGGESFVSSINGDGSGQRRLFSTPVIDPVFSWDGRKIAYVKVVDGAEQIAVANADGSAETIITAISNARVRSPAWSPDGSKIAFSAAEEENDQIFMVTIGSAEITKVVDNPYADLDPAFSPDGNTLVYVSDTTGRRSFQVFALALSGLTPPKPQQLTNSGGQNTSPSLSPDGKTIVFISTRNRSLSKVFVMRADGSDERPLLIDDGSAENRDPVWSPDGQYVAFVSNRNGGLFQVFAALANGRSVQQVTNGTVNVAGVRFRPGF